MNRWMLTVEAQDRPGIVASVTKSLADAHCNLADVSMTRLSGVFVMLAVVIVPEGESPVDLWSDADAQSFAGNVNWREISEEQSHPHALEGELWNITVYGSDKPGIVSAVAEALAHHGININDLSTRLVGEGESATYTMLIDATVPRDNEALILTDELRAIGERLGVACHAVPVDADTL